MVLLQHNIAAKDRSTAEKRDVLLSVFLTYMMPIKLMVNFTNFLFPASRLKLQGMMDVVRLEILACGSLKGLEKLRPAPWDQHTFQRPCQGCQRHSICLYYH